MKSTRIPRVLIMISMCLAMLLPVQAYAASNQLVYGSNGTITRAEWIHDLVVTFNMTVDEGLKPDDYYDDIKGTTYYDDIITAMYFGVIDLDAGEKFEPDAKVTREFAAHTLSYCLGYQPDEDMEYTMNDQSELEYPADDQIAVDKGWFALTGGKFQPKSQITTAQIRKMLQDAAKIVADSEVDENHNNVYEFADGVVEVPETSSFEFGENNQIILYDTSIAIKKNTVFAVYSNGIAYTYKATKVDKQEDCLVIDTQVVSYDDAVDSVDAEGIIEADLQEFVAADGVDCEIEYEDTSTQASRIHGSKKVKDIKLSKQIGSGKVSCNITNIVVEYRLENGNYRFAVKGKMDTDCTFSGKKELSLPFGYLNVAGVGKIEVKMIYSAKGSATVGFTTNVTTGIEQTNGSPVRSLDNYTSPSWKFSAKAELKAACNINFTIEIPMIAKGYVYGEAGIKSTPDMEVYTDGKDPKVCIDLPAYLFAETGYSLTVGGQTLASATFPIYNEKNSPIKVCYHIEDGNCVDVCKRAGTSKRVGRRGYYTSPSITSGSGTYGGECFVAPYAEYKTFEYSLDDDGNATITKYAGNVKALTIPDELDGHPVVAIANDVFKGNTALQSVVIPDAVTSIGAYAFLNCSNLQDVILPSNSKYTTISEGVFKNATKLNGVAISDYVTSINTQAFYGSGLQSVHLSEKITQIGSEAFYGCRKLSDVVLPKYLEKFGDGCFGDCDALVSIEIPKYITGCSDDLYPNSTGGYGYQSPLGMFCGCDNLKNVTFAKGTTKIAMDLFNSCTGLEIIELPDTITEVQSKAFYDCVNLKEIHFPKTVTKIGVLAFAGCNSLEKVDIPDAVTTIDCASFAWCEKLKDVKLPARLVDMGTWAFKGCVSLEEIEIPKNFSNVPMYYNGMTIFKTESPFIDCTKLKKVVFQDGLKTIPANTLKWCSDSVEEVVIPDSVIQIGANAFNSCRKLNKIQLSSNLVSIDDAAFIACSSLEKIELPDSINSIGTSVFEDCSSLKDVKLPKYRIGINQKTFMNCSSLVDITLPDTLQYIYSSAFEGCTNLKQITLPAGFKEVQDCAFKNCKKLNKISITGNIIGKNAFENCYELTDVKMSNTVQTIESGAFLNCNELEQIVLSNNLQTLGDSAFQGCTMLKNVIVPYKVTTINSNTFKDCTKLEQVTILENVSEISKNAFSYFDEVTIYGIVGSYAQTYANENNIKFQAINVENTQILFDKTDYTLMEGQSIRIPITVTPQSAAGSVKWVSSDEKVASVDKTGEVSAKKVGECNVTATVGKTSVTCKIVVTDGWTYFIIEPKDSTELEVGGQLHLEAYYKNDMSKGKIDDKELIWWSSDPTIATVDEDGIVRGIKKGKIQIEVWYKNNTDKKSSLELTVTTQKGIVTAITLDKTSLELESDDTYQLTATITPEEAANKKLTWSSSNEEVATVTDGKVTAKKAGTATITVSAENGTVKASCQVKVSGRRVTGVQLSKKTMRLDVGNCGLLEATVLPENAENQEVTWSSSDEDIATIDEKTGIVMGVAAGEADITVTTKEGNYTATCSVKVSEVEDPDDIIPVTEIKIPSDSELLPEDNKIEAGNQFAMPISVEPEDATNTDIIWISNNKECAEIDENGIVTAKKAGEVTITAVSVNGGKQAEYTFTITGAILAAIELDRTQLYLQPGEEQQISATALPEGATAQFEWSSSDDGVAMVDEDGVVTAISTGKATITVVDKRYRDVKAMCIVTVQEKSAEKPGSDQAQQPSPGGTTPTPDAAPTPQQPTPQPSTGQPATPQVNNPAGVNANSISLAKVSRLKVKAKGSRKITISWAGVSNARNYQVQISMKKNFKKGSKVRISPKTKFIWKKLKKGKTYYVRVRACANGQYGAWSKAKKVKVK